MSGAGARWPGYGRVHLVVRGRTSMNGDGTRGTSLGARALSGLGWAYLGTFCKSLLSLLALVILARLLTPAGLRAAGHCLDFYRAGIQVRPGGGRAGHRATGRSDQPPRPGGLHPVAGGRHFPGGRGLAAGAGPRGILQRTRAGGGS